MADSVEHSEVPGVIQLVDTTHQASSVTLPSGTWPIGEPIESNDVLLQELTQFYGNRFVCQPISTAAAVPASSPESLPKRSSRKKL